MTKEIAQQNVTLAAEVESLKKRGVFSIDDLSTKNEKLKKLVDTLEALTKKTDILEGTIVDLEGQLQKKEQALRQQRDSADIVSSEYSALKAKHGETSSEYQALQAKNDELETNFSALNQEIENLRAESSTVDGLKDEMSFLKKHMAKLAAENEALVRKQESATEQEGHAKEEKESAEQAKQEYEAELARVRSLCDLQLDKLNKELESVQSTCKAQQKALEKMHTTSMEAMKQHLEANANAEATQACKDAEMEELRGQISRNTNRCQLMEKELEAKSFMLEKASNDYSSLLEKFVEIQRDSTSLQNNIEADSTEAAGTIAQLRDENNRLINQNKQLAEKEAQLAEKEVSEAGVQARCDELSEELQSLKTKFADTQGSHALEIKMAAEELEALQNKLEKAETNLKFVQQESQDSLSQLREQHKVTSDAAASKISGYSEIAYIDIKPPILDPATYVFDLSDKVG